VVTGAAALGPVIVLTDRAQARQPLVEVVRAVVDAGARTVLLREKDLPVDERARLAEALRRVLEPVSGMLIVASGPGDRVHLAAADPLPDSRPRVLGRSCHDAGELARAASAGMDYVTCSPVFASTSKPGYGPALGPVRLGELCRGAGVPVYALGGVQSPDAARECLEAGAAGVAVMGYVMRAAQPGRAVARLLAALS
jgi:thiamine-phosphate pyrophosphorylase